VFRRLCSLAALAFLLACLAHLAGVPVHSQTSEKPHTFQANAQIVVLDVVVTGKNHRPFSGLTQQDFQVLENGKPQTIRNFEEHTVASPGESAPAALPPDMFTNIPQVDKNNSVTVLVLDSLNTPLDDQRRVRNQVLKYLKNPKPGQKLAIFTLQSQLQLIQDFTADPGKLAAALNSNKNGVGKQVSPLIDTSGEAALTRETASAMREFFNPQAAAQMEQFMSDQGSYRSGARLRLTLRALQALAHYLGGYPGRKNVVWFSGGFPLSIFPNPNGSDEFSSVRNDENEVRKTNALLASAQMAIYPISAEGVMTDAPYDAGADSRTVTPDQLKHPQGTVEEANASQAAMSLIARDTGGAAFYGTNDLADALDRVMAHSSHYYTLTYTSTNNANDGKFRKINVKLARRGYQLDFRRGYYADPPRAPAVLPAASVDTADRLSAYLRAGSPDAIGIPLTLRVVRNAIPAATQAPVHGDNAELKGASNRYGVDLMIPARGLEFETALDGKHTLRAEAGLLLYDAQGKAQNWLLRQVNLNLDEARYELIQKNGLNLYFDIDSPSEAIFLRGGIYDRSNNLAGTVAVPLASVK
jgi:VWFA-related protein